MATEYDLFGWPAQEWEEYARFLWSRDPWHHLCSIHNCVSFYYYTQDWVTHCSMQRTDLYKHVEETDAYLESYHKPVVWDEIAYEGNIDLGWGNISGQELVRRFWESVLRGGCAGHGETYVHPQDILWWSHGGKLHGDSEPRLAFLLKIWDEVPGGYLQRGGGIFDETVAVPLGEEKRVNWEEQQYVSFEIHYYGFGRPSYREFDLPENERYQVDVIDTWNMTVTDAGIHSGFTRIPLPGREYMAIRLRRI